MVKVRYSNFETINEVLGSFALNYDKLKEENLNLLKKIWQEVAGKKFSKVSYVNAFNEDIIKVVCADSFVSNELFTERENLLKKINEKLKKSDIIMKDIKFEYKNWNRNSHE